MINWIDIKKQLPVNKQKVFIKTKDFQIIPMTYSAPTGWFIEFDDRGQMRGRVYEADEILEWTNNEPL